MRFPFAPNPVIGNFHGWQQFKNRCHPRLQEARSLMLGEKLDAAEAAFRVGYESPSQFSREYRWMFSAPPCQNIAALISATS